MKPAADEMAEALAEAKILPPAVPVVANVTAAPVKDRKRSAGCWSSR